MPAGVTALAAAACILAVAGGAARGPRPLRAILASAVCGVGTLALLALLAPLTGVSLPLNRFTGFVAAVLGTPGVIALLVLNVLFL